jgi:hypothetical protein
MSFCSSVGLPASVKQRKTQTPLRDGAAVVRRATAGMRK